MAERINWYRTPIDRERMAELTRRSDLPGLLHCLGLLLVYAATLTASLYFFLHQMWALMIVACYVHSMFHGFLGMEATVHELSHGTAFKTKWLNEFFYRLFSFLSWNNPIHFRYSHMGHHQLTVHHGLDFEVILEPSPFAFWDYFSWVTFDWKKFRMIMFPNIAHFFGKADKDVFFWNPLFEKGDPHRKQMVRWARFMVIGHLVLLALFIYFKLWVLIYVVTFGYFFADFLARGCGMQQHVGLTPDVPDWRLSCHTMKFGRVMAFFYWNMNYHIEHHMFAAVPFHRLRQLHKEVAHDMPEPVHGYFRGVLRVLEIQKKQRENPGYCVVPKFPETAAPARTA